MKTVIQSLNGRIRQNYIVLIFITLSMQVIFSQGIWNSTSITNAPSARIRHTAVWTGSQMIIWGGNPPYLNSGGIYDLLGDSWTTTSTVNAPAMRSFHTAVWTGSKMVIWGGGTDGVGLNTGGMYDPAANSWSATSVVNAPGNRNQQTAVWTGNKMMVWGGQTHNGTSYSWLNTGGLFDPVNNSWTPTSTVNAPDGRQQHIMICTGTKVIIWGGADLISGISFKQTGGVYDLATDTWTPTSLTNAPSPRVSPSAVWTGSKMIIWGGGGVGGQFNTGGIYDPELNTWTAIATENAPEHRIWHSAVWTGNRMIIWGGYNSGSSICYNNGAMYDPVNNSWSPVTTTSAPSARQYQTTVWTGSKMIVWGGAGTDLNAPVKTGGIFGDSLVAISGNENEIPNDYELSQNYPNPFNPNTNIDFRIPDAEFVTLDVINSLGEKVAQVINEQKQPGAYSVVFDGSDLSSGVYFYKLTAGKFTQTRKMIIVK